MEHSRIIASGSGHAKHRGAYNKKYYYFQKILKEQIFNGR
jgi:hypothetical protein